MVEAHRRKEERRKEERRKEGRKEDNNEDDATLMYVGAVSCVNRSTYLYIYRLP